MLIDDRRSLNFENDKNILGGLIQHFKSINKMIRNETLLQLIVFNRLIYGFLLYDYLLCTIVHTYVIKR